MRNHYETVCIVRPDVAEDAIKGVIQKATATLTEGGGELKKLDEWGRRRLAYPIQKKTEGYYFVMEYMSAPGVSKEIGRLLGINEDVLRHQTVRMEKRAAAVAAKAKAEEARLKEKAAKEAAAAAKEGGVA